MGPPKGGDGLARAIAELALPSVGVVAAVSLTKELYGGMAAGLVYLLLWSGILAGIYLSAKYWNIRYTAGFTVAGIILWIMVPNVVSEIVHPVFGALGTLIGGVFLILMVALFLEKAGFDDLLSNL